MDALIELVRKYQSFDFETWDFTATRTAEEYCDLLADVHPSQLSRFYNGKLEKPWAIVRSFMRTFPHAADEVARAMSAETAEVA